MPGATDHPLYPRGLLAAASQAAFRGEVSGEQLLDEALAACERLDAKDPLFEMMAESARSIAALFVGSAAGSVAAGERAVEVARSAGNPFWLAHSLNGLSSTLVLAGDLEGALPFATEGLALARQVGAPLIIANAEAALAGALTGSDPEEARALLRDSLRFAESVGNMYHTAVTQAVLNSARMGAWDDVVDLSPRAIRSLHWYRDLPQLAGILNVVACAVAQSEPEAAALLQGGSRRMAIAGQPKRAAVSDAQVKPSPREGSSAAAPPDGGIIVDLRRRTTALLRDLLGEGRLRQLRSEGESMDDDRVVASALDVIDKVRARASL